jgi:hypothetical protein
LQRLHGLVDLLCAGIAREVEMRVFDAAANAQLDHAAGLGPE